MRFAVLGTGDVGHAIATKLVSLGHAVRMGSRAADNPKASAWAASGASHGTFADAAAFAEIVVNATGGMHTLAALEAAGAEHLAGKVLVDISNPLDFSRGFPPTLSVSNADSLGEQIQRAFPGARVVKTLNTVANSIMVNPGLVPGPHHLFVSGDDASAKAIVTELLQSFGWRDIIDLGGIESARATEAWLLLWTRLYGALGTAEFNLRLVKAER
jgi:8-hydroxy-5-deazaflavin:NADPH oxidoreductase